LAHRAQPLAHQQVGEPAAKAAVEQLAQVSQDKGGEALHGLERDVAGKAVGDYHVDAAAIDVAAFDVTDVVDIGRHRAQRGGGGAGQIAALGVFLPVGENSYARA